MTPEIQARVIDRLIDTGKADEPWALIVLAAMEGEQELNAFLDKTHSVESPKRSTQGQAPAAEPPGAYVASISVEGFRGIGPAAISLEYGPPRPKQATSTRRNDLQQVPPGADDGLERNRSIEGGQPSPLLPSEPQKIDVSEVPV